jgi:hypothetical protein
VTKLEPSSIERNKDARHPNDYYWKPGLELRPPPPRAVPSSLSTYSRRATFSDWIVVREEPEMTPRVQLFADHLWQGDELMDSVVAMFSRTGAGAGRKLLNQALDDGIESLEDPPAELTDLFGDLDRLPEWFDEATWEEGRRIWINASLSGRVAMAVYDGFGTFVGEEVSSATGATGMFVRNLPRRLLETGQWFYDATLPDLPDRYSPAFKATVRVRLMHAQARAGLRRSWGDAHFSHHGNPISNATTMGAAVTFALFPLLFDHAHGRRCSRADLDAAMMYWSYLAYLFGVAEEIIPTSALEAIEIADWMMATSGGPTQSTGEIMKAWTAPLTRSDGRLSVRGGVTLSPLLGGLAYFGGEPMVRALMQETAGRTVRLQPWTWLTGLLVRLNVLQRIIDDRLPGAHWRRVFRAQSGDPAQRVAVQLMKRTAARRGMSASSYASHDDSPNVQPGCPLQ